MKAVLDSLLYLTNWPNSSKVKGEYPIFLPESIMRILIVEDNPADFRLLQGMIGEVPHVSIELFHENRLAGGVQRLAQGSLDVALIDLGLPDSQGLETFTSLHAAAPHIPMIVLSGDENEDWAVEAVRHGAQDYLMKNQVSGPLLLHAMQYAIERKQAEEALREMIHNSTRMVRLGDIEKAVCWAFGLEPQSLQADDKSKCVSHPRMLAMWLARKHTRAALSEIGRYFGRRSHSTVVSAQKRVDRWVACGSSIDLAERAWAVDEAIRHVERHLAAG